VGTGGVSERVRGVRSGGQLFRGNTSNPGYCGSNLSSILSEVGELEAK